MLEKFMRSISHCKELVPYCMDSNNGKYFALQTQAEKHSPSANLDR
jgi:hypothetical protein